MSEPQIPAENVATLDDNTTLVLLMPDETLTESFIFIRKLVESGTEVVAATPSAVRAVLKILREEEQ